MKYNWLLPQSNFLLLSCIYPLICESDLIFIKSSLLLKLLLLLLLLLSLLFFFLLLLYQSQFVTH